MTAEERALILADLRSWAVDKAVETFGGQCINQPDAVMARANAFYEYVTRPFQALPEETVQ